MPVITRAKTTREVAIAAGGPEPPANRTAACSVTIQCAIRAAPQGVSCIHGSWAVPVRAGSSPYRWRRLRAAAHPRSLPSPSPAGLAENFVATPIHTPLLHNVLLCNALSVLQHSLLWHQQSLCESEALQETRVSLSLYVVSRLLHWCRSGVIVQMFQWSWDSIAQASFTVYCAQMVYSWIIAQECTQFLGPAGYGFVQSMSPNIPNGHVSLTFPQHLLLKSIFKAVNGLPITR